MGLPPAVENKKDHKILHQNAKVVKPMLLDDPDSKKMNYSINVQVLNF